MYFRTFPFIRERSSRLLLSYSRFNNLFDDLSLFLMRPNLLCVGLVEVFIRWRMKTAASFQPQRWPWCRGKTLLHTFVAAPFDPKCPRDSNIMHLRSEPRSMPTSWILPSPI